MFVGTNKSLVLDTIDGSNESVAKWRWEMYLSISHYHFIVYTPRFIIYCSIRETVWRQWTKISDESTIIIDLFASDISKYTHLILFTFIDDFFSYQSLVDQMIIIWINFFFSKYLAVCRLQFRNGVDIKETAHLSLINQ